jgi:hypothetical protein
MARFSRRCANRQPSARVTARLSLLAGDMIDLRRSNQKKTKMSPWGLENGIGNAYESQEDRGLL